MMNLSYNSNLMHKLATTARRGDLLAALDIGSSKVCCLIARLTDNGALNVLGIGHHESKGMKSGRIVDMEAAQRAVGLAVQAAENMAGETIHTVAVNISGVHTGSHLLHGELNLTQDEVMAQDLRRIMGYARDVEVPGHSQLIHAIATQYRVDDQTGITDPKGMHGKQLGAQIHAVTATETALKNRLHCITSNHLSVEAYCVDVYAAALAALTEDDMDLGCTVIDMGAGTTEMAVFIDGQFVFADAIPVGGAHVTQDIARGLTTSLHHAERLKTLYGHAIRTARDEGDMIEVPQAGDDNALHSGGNSFGGNFGGHFVPRSYLTGIIQPRLEEIFELVRARLEASGYAQSAGRRVILTGGASQLTGLRDLAALILDKQVRLAPLNAGHNPNNLRILGLADATTGPAFATVCGMLLYLAEHPEEIPARTVPAAAGGSWLQQSWQWLRENW